MDDDIVGLSGAVRDARFFQGKISQPYNTIASPCCVGMTRPKYHEMVTGLCASNASPCVSLTETEDSAGSN